MSKTRAIRKAQAASPSPEPQQPSTPPPPPAAPTVNPQDQEVQKRVSESFSQLVVAMRSLNTQVNGLGLPNQTVPLIRATLDEIDSNLGLVTDRMWALRQIVEAESAKG